jgi:hypothetical protein
MNEMLDDEVDLEVDEEALVVEVIEEATLEDPVDETLDEAFEDDELTAELAAELEVLVAGVVDVEDDIGVALVGEAATGVVDAGAGVAAGSEVAAALHERWSVN